MCHYFVFSPGKPRGAAIAWTSAPETVTVVRECPSVSSGGFPPGTCVGDGVLPGTHVRRCRDVQTHAAPCATSCRVVWLYAGVGTVRLDRIREASSWLTPVQRRQSIPPIVWWG